MPFVCIEPMLSEPRLMGRSAASDQNLYRGAAQHPFKMIASDPDYSFH